MSSMTTSARRTALGDVERLEAVLARAVLRRVADVADDHLQAGVAEVQRCERPWFP
jgi:hypothetical protein